MKWILGLYIDAAALLLLALALATVALWARSCFVAKTFAWHAGADPARPRYAYCARGRLGLVAAVRGRAL